MALNIQVHILTAGFESPNGCAFLFPLIRFQRSLCDLGINIRIFNNVEIAVQNCDILLIENKFYGVRWAVERDSVLAELLWCKEQVGALIYVDITDSTGWDHADALPFVTAYLKNQLLVDRNRYLSPMYGYRPFSNYFHEQFSVVDDNPAYSKPINDPDLLGRLGVGWNSGFADWSLYGPMRMALYRRTQWLVLLGEPKGWNRPSISRNNDMTCRFGISYARETVSWQRKEIREIMKGKLATDKLNRRGYFRELCNSKVVVSPFGLGEITLKDFEVFITGGLLFKPDMSHIETWADLFVDGETMVSHRWDLKDFEEKLDEILSDYGNFVDIAYEGQRRYRKSMIGKQAGERFANHFHGLLTRDWEQPWVAND